MRARSGGILLGLAMACAWPSTADAQFVGGGGSLGGYGASSAFGGPGMGGGGPMVIPYGGMTEGFMPGRMGGSPLSPRPRPTTGMDAPRPSSRLSTMAGGMTSKPGGLRPMSGGMGRGIGPGSFLSNPMGSRPGVMPPSIGYPFRQPPSLLSPASGGAGMSM